MKIEDIDFRISGNKIEIYVKPSQDFFPARNSEYEYLYGLSLPEWINTGYYIKRDEKYAKKNGSKLRIFCLRKYNNRKIGKRKNN